MQETSDQVLTRILKENNIEIELTPMKMYTKGGNVVVERPKIQVFFTNTPKEDAVEEAQT